MYFAYTDKYVFYRFHSLGIAIPFLGFSVIKSTSLSVLFVQKTTITISSESVAYFFRRENCKVALTLPYVIFVRCDLCDLFAYELVGYNWQLSPPSPLSLQANDLRSESDLVTSFLKRFLIHRI